MKKLITRLFTDAHKGRVGHISVQHYAQLIEDGCDLLLKQQLDTPVPQYEIRRERVRFAKELHPGETAELHGTFSNIVHYVMNISLVTLKMTNH